MLIQIPNHILEECRSRLLIKKSDLLNRIHILHREFSESKQETSGDEADQSMSNLAENNYLSATKRIRVQLLEIEAALARLSTGRFGVCEETEELIETDRLLTIPWTRLSIEGAEIREALSKRYA